ncbi:hypothetical protein CYMTET_46615 [Cymbomonas tetramitiformis]|uniref:Uncharacterized protein n=1 Tax=Cymbomonas tetramitiformis TaxID=36881 RepID=A0AAE0BX73_9CHLO|nr:hypothetical protein CYMTET_46615 [Cymbomonas tetramitiformis]
MAGVTTRGARRALMKDSDEDNVVARLKRDVLNSPTPVTPAVAEPAAVKADMIPARKLYQEQAALVRQADGKDDAKLGKFVVYLKTHFANAGLDVSPFDFDDVTRELCGRSLELERQLPKPSWRSCLTQQRQESQQAAEERRASEQRAAEERRTSERRVAEERRASEQRAAEERWAAEQLAAETREAARRLAIDEIVAQQLAARTSDGQRTGGWQRLSWKRGPGVGSGGAEAREEVGATGGLESLEAREEAGVPEVRGPGGSEVPEGPEA